MAGSAGKVNESPPTLRLANGRSRRREVREDMGAEDMKERLELLALALSALRLQEDVVGVSNSSLARLHSAPVGPKLNSNGFCSDFDTLPW